MCLLVLVAIVNSRIRKLITSCAVLAAASLLAEPAEAFRCGSKLVKDGMNEQQVIAACGEPTTRRHLGFTLRVLDLGTRRISPGWTESHFPGYGVFSEEVMVTEYVYDFGPRKLMRRLRFEGGILVTVETIGYGHIQKER